MRSLAMRARLYQPRAATREPRGALRQERAAGRARSSSSAEPFRRWSFQTPSRGSPRVVSSAIDQSVSPACTRWYCGCGPAPVSRASTAQARSGDEGDDDDSTEHVFVVCTNTCSLVKVGGRSPRRSSVRAARVRRRPGARTAARLRRQRGRAARSRSSGWSPERRVRAARAAELAGDARGPGRPVPRPAPTHARRTANARVLARANPGRAPPSLDLTELELRADHLLGGTHGASSSGQPSAVSSIAARTAAAAGRGVPSARCSAAWNPVRSPSSRKPKKLTSSTSGSHAARRIRSP